MNVLATSVGSSGDFLPTLAIAAALHRRGHRVRMVTNPFYERQVQRCGLDLVAAGQYSDVFQWVETQPELMDPLKGGSASSTSSRCPIQSRSTEALSAAPKPSAPTSC